MSNLRISLVEEILKKEKSLSLLCREYNVSRPTAYKWLNRYKQGLSMESMSKAPKTNPNKTSSEMEAIIVAKRVRFPYFKSSKIKIVLERDDNVQNVPAASTITSILHRHNLIAPEATRDANHYIRFASKEPNNLWQADYKGHFALTTNQRCYPLSFVDDCSRYHLGLKALDNERYDDAAATLIQHFIKYGLPNAFLCDNGNPWGTKSSIRGYTRFDVMLMDHDVLPMHIRAGHPQTQGKIERLNRTLKRECIEPFGPFSSLVDAQRGFDKYIQIYNEIRPHEAINNLVPADVYVRSSRLMPQKIHDWEYSGELLVRKINKGFLRIDGKLIYFSDGLNGLDVAIKQSEYSDIIEIIYRNFCLAKFNRHDNVFVTKKISRLSYSIK